MNGARAKVKPIPERPIAYAVANLFLKYRAVITEKDWYSSAKPIPERSKERLLLSNAVSVTGMWGESNLQPSQIDNDLSFVLCFQSHQ